MARRLSQSAANKRRRELYRLKKEAAAAALEAKRARRRERYHQKKAAEARAEAKRLARNAARRAAYKAKKEAEQAARDARNARRREAYRLKQAKKRKVADRRPPSKKRRAALKGWETRRAREALEEKATKKAKRKRKLPGAPKKAPKGTGRIYAGKLTKAAQAEAETDSEAIRETMDELAKRFAVAGSIVTVAINADGSVDGEIVLNVPKGQDTADFLLDIENEVHDIGIPAGSYVGGGLMFQAREGEELSDDSDKRHLGLYIKHTYAHGDEMLAEAFVAIREITRYHDLAGRLSPSRVVFRLNINPDSKAPQHWRQDRMPQE